jgi:hypothetical protein
MILKTAMERASFEKGFRSIIVPLKGEILSEEVYS